MPPAPADRKAELRQAAAARRDALSAAERKSSSERIAGRLGELLRGWEPRSVAAYAPIRSEADALAVLGELDTAGIETALPTQSGDGLLFRRWDPGEPLVSAGFGVREPRREAPVLIPAVIVMPLVGFDRHGSRLGYGKGHYDRAIAALARSGNAPRLVGVAFAVQEVEAIPIEPHDLVLDMVVTENETIAFDGR
jgi:5-formyltetrahydrofolate cyclo-ligase